MKLKPFLLMAITILMADACFFHHTFPPTPGPATITPPPTLTPPISNTTAPMVPPTTAATTVSLNGATQTPATLASRLNTNGPYLAYLRDAENGPEIVLMDADGSGELSAPFPMDVNSMLPPLLSDLLSSDGAWLAFYTGSAGPAFGQSGPEASDLALNLMSLSNSSLQTGKSRLVTRLLSADYPANFAKEVSQLGMADVTAQALRDSFVAGITQSIAWSPDGTRLAFAGQMDGLSSDLYLYDANTRSIQRLSSGPENIQWITWSPDGKWILDGSVYFVGEGMTYNVYATSVDGKTSRKLLSDYRTPGTATWINDSEFLTFQSENGPGNYGLERVNVETGKIDGIWADPFSTFLNDPQGKVVAVLTQTGGLVLVDLATLQRTTVALPSPAQAYGAGSSLIPLDPGADRHFILSLASGTGWYYLSTEGILTDAGLQADLVSVASDQKHWIALKDDLRLFTNGSDTPGIFAMPPGMQAGDFQRIIWRPDSSGIFLVSTSSQLYALDFSSGDYALVEQHLAAAGTGHFMTSAGPAGLIWVH